MYKVFEGEKTWLTPIGRPVERLVYKVGGVREDEEMPWTTYTLAMLLFSVVTLVVTYAILRGRRSCRSTRCTSGTPRTRRPTPRP